MQNNQTNEQKVKKDTFFQMQGKMQSFQGMASLSTYEHYKNRLW